MILTHGYRHRTFGGDPDVVKRVLTINSRPHQIIGVMPAEFDFGGAVVNTLRMSSPTSSCRRGSTERTQHRYFGTSAWPG